MAKKAKRERARDMLSNGDEVLSPIPVAPPIGYRREPTMVERIRSMVRSEHMRLAALQAGAETFDEADDFEVGDDYDPSSPYEEVFEPVDYEARQRLRQEEYEASIELRKQEIDENGSPKLRQSRENLNRRRADAKGKQSTPKSGEDEKPEVSSGVRSGVKGSESAS